METVRVPPHAMYDARTDAVYVFPATTMTVTKEGQHTRYYFPKGYEHPMAYRDGKIMCIEQMSLTKIIPTL